MGASLEAVEITKDLPCPYLKGQLRRIFILHMYYDKPPASMEPVLHARQLRKRFIPQGLTDEGLFFLSGNDCPSCRACIPLRIATKNYQFSRNELRILKNNGNLLVNFLPVRVTPEHYRLFTDYNARRHPEKNTDMTDMATLENYFHVHSHMIEVRDRQNKLVAAVILDVLDSALSSYTIYYDLDESTPQRSLGTFCYLKTIEAAQKKSLDHIYIGSWVDGDSKLNYKKRFQNLETLTDQGWVAFNPATHTQGPDMKKCVPAGTPWIPC